jgi:hypothetical protein
VDGGPAGEVHDAAGGQPAGAVSGGTAEVEDPVGDGEVDERAQRTTNTPQPRNFARSAMAPEIRAGVMIANISWNIANARPGIAYGAPLSETGR